MAGEQSAPAIVGVGAVLGEELITNEQLIAMTGMNSSPEAIVRLTMIEQRYWREGCTLMADLGEAAAKQALRSAGIEGPSLAGLYLTTVTPDFIGGPYNAGALRHRLNVPAHARAIEFQAACAGSVAALSEAADKVALQPDAIILTVNSEVMSSVINPADRSSAILFGDAAGAGVVRNVRGAEPPRFAWHQEYDPTAIYAPAGGLAEPGQGADDPRRKITMDGKRVTKHATTIMPLVARQAAFEDGALNPRNNKIDWDRYDLFVPHQANGRLIEGLWEELGVPEEKRLLTVDQHGNTSSASVLLALHTAIETGHFNGNGRILTTALGAGVLGVGGAMDVQLSQPYGRPLSPAYRG